MGSAAIAGFLSRRVLRIDPNVLIAEIAGPKRERNRSEEHTSELQSHLNLVCRLLLEKKKKSFVFKCHLIIGSALHMLIHVASGGCVRLHAAICCAVLLQGCRVFTVIVEYMRVTH